MESRYQEFDTTAINATQLTSSQVRPECLEGLQIKRRVASAVGCSNTPEQRVETYQQLYALFKQRAEVLCSDGVIEESGTIQVGTTTGATLTSDNVLDALQSREERGFH